MAAWSRSRPPPDSPPAGVVPVGGQVRALENQMVWLSANQAGSFGSLRFVDSAKVVDPGGEILAETQGDGRRGRRRARRGQDAGTGTPVDGASQRPETYVFPIGAAHP